MAGDRDPAAQVVDLVEGRDYTVTRRPEPVSRSRAVARKVGRSRRPGGVKLGKMRFSTKDPAAMVAVGLAALALDWLLRSPRDPE